MKERNNSLDLLRIISMLMVLCNHILSWGGLIDGGTEPMSGAWLAGNTLFVFLLPAVNCFVLISGYFLCTAEFKLKRLVNLWVDCAFYNVGIYLIMCFCNQAAFSITGLIRAVLVISMENYWFVTAYFLLYLLSPFLNLAIQAMDRKMHGLCCLVLLGVFSVAANLIYTVDFTSINGGYGLLWFCVIYVVAAYIRLYIPERIRFQKWMFPVFVLSALTICGEKYLAHLITPHIFGEVVMDSLFYSYNSIIAVICALSLFQFFRGLKIRWEFGNRLIRFFAPLTFAVYLIHAQPHFRDLYLFALEPTFLANSPWMIPYVIGATLVSALIFCMIEYVRKWLFKVVGIHKGVEKTSDKLQVWGKEKLERIL